MKQVKIVICIRGCSVFGSTVLPVLPVKYNIIVRSKKTSWRKMLKLILCIHGIGTDI